MLYGIRHAERSSYEKKFQTVYRLRPYSGNAASGGYFEKKYSGFYGGKNASDS